MSPSNGLLGVAAAVAIAPIALAVGIGLGAASGSEDAQSPGVDPSCLDTAGAGMDAGRGERIDQVQAANAQTICQVAADSRLPARAAVIAIATAMQESRLVNHQTATDHDSLGLFQQRPSQGWGTAAQVTDPVHASGQFYARLLKVPHWQSIPPAQAAQAVQRSRYPGAYARWEPFATRLVATFQNKAATCPSPIPHSGLGGRILAHAQRWLGTPYQYGGGNEHGPTVGYNSNGSGRPGWDCSGLTLYAVYQATGGRVRLPRTAAAQYTDRRFHRVPYDRLQPGDLVFWAGTGGASAAPGHVGVYAGGRRFLHAPRTGDRVRWDSMAPGTYRHRTFLAGVRITSRYTDV